MESMVNVNKPMTLNERQFIFSKNVMHLLGFIFLNDLKFTFGEAFRTKEQAEIYAKEGKGIADSLHCQRLAIDLNLFTYGNEYITDSNAPEYIKLGTFWEKLHPSNRWGGNFKRKDGNHFEMRMTDENR